MIAQLQIISPNHMKNLRRTSPFKYINALVFIIVFQFFTVNAAFTNTEGKTLSIEYIGKNLYEISLQGEPIGVLREKQILKALKGIDYTNFKLHLFDFSKSIFPDLRKAHLDIMGLTQLTIIPLLIKDPSGLINSKDFGYISVYSILYFIIKGIAVFAVIEDEKNIPRCLLIAASSGLNPFLGMIAERWILRENNFEIIQSHEDVRISDIQFERYVAAINKHLAEANL
jgi:hypothetical protein